jgi:plastocyanin
MGSTSAPSDAVVGGFMNVSPITGAAPLTVTVEATVNTVKLCGASTYTLNWGDGSASQTISVPANSCNILAQTFTHTYSSAGTYSIKLASGAHESVSTITVTGAGSQTTSGTSATPGTLAISMNANSFSPNTVTINSGTVVTWTNTDSMNHTVTADNGSYNKSLAPGESYSLTFTIRGEYKYYCALHGAAGGVGMSGKIIVE